MLTDEERSALIDLIHNHQYSIIRASEELNIPYANAKAINSTFLIERRTNKKHFRSRVRFPHMNVRPTFTITTNYNQNQNLAKSASNLHLSDQSLPKEMPV